jgi:shikimate dehydrogenase
VKAPTGTTRLAAVIGHPVRHSLSPVLHNAAFEALGLDWVYLAFDVAPGGAAAALDAMRTLGVDGLSVTMPHKADVAASVDVPSGAVRALQACNCVVRLGDGRLAGENTDGGGFVDSVREAGHDPAGRRCVVLGAGGAARAVVAALADAAAADIAVVNRSQDRAVEAARLAAPVGRVGALDDVRSAHLVVNATSVGMGEDRSLPCPAELLGPGQVVADLVYHPLETAWLAAGRARGAAGVDGLGMLVHQAARAFTLWTGVPAPVAVMRAAALAELERRSGRS